MGPEGRAMPFRTACGLCRLVFEFATWLLFLRSLNEAHLVDHVTAQHRALDAGFLQTSSQPQWEASWTSLGMVVSQGISSGKSGEGAWQPSAPWHQGPLGRCSGLIPREQPQGWRGKGRRTEEQAPPPQPEGRLWWQPLSSLSPVSPAR